MKIETLGLGNKVEKLTLNTADVWRLIIEKLGIAGLVLDDATKIVIVSRFSYQEKGDSLIIEKYDEDFRGRRPRK